MASLNNIFNTLHMILHSWNSTISEGLFNFESMYICRISSWGCIQVTFDNNNSSNPSISSIYSSQYSSLPITLPKCFCPDDVILMLVLWNISAAFEMYFGLTINIALLGFEKYPYFWPTSKWSFHQLPSFDNLHALVKLSAKATI